MSSILGVSSCTARVPGGHIFFLMIRRPPRSTRTDTLFPYTTLFRSVSRVLALTENRLGYPLFERAKSRLLPTPEARRLYLEVEQVYGGIQRVNDLAANLGRRGAGELRVVASASFGQRLIPQALERFRVRNPLARRPGGRRVGKEGVRTWRMRW